MTASAHATRSRPRLLLSGAALSLLLALGAAGSASAAPGPSQFANGLHVPAGGIVDPDNRVWVSDHNGGFCRLTPADDRGPGTLDHPSSPGAPASVARTCLGGLLPDAALGPDAAGQPAFSDPTPEFAGNGDEIVLIPDGAAPSMDVWRAHWNPDTRLFEADPETDVIQMNADVAQDRPRPTAISIAPDGNAYVVFQRSSSIQRIVEPTAASPKVELVGFTSDGVGTAAIAAGYSSFGPLAPPTVYIGEGSGIRQISGARGTTTTTTSASPFSAGAGALVSTLAYRVTDASGGHGTLYAGTAEATPPLVLPGPDRVLRLNPDAAPTVVASGFSTVGGLAIRQEDGGLYIFDDPALAMDTEPLGRGRGFLLGDPYTQILTGPSTPAGQPALDPEFTADSTPTFTYAGEFDRRCSMVPADAATNIWQACGSATTYTPSTREDGRWRFAVRSVDGARIGAADTRYFTVDTKAPTATPVIVTPKQGGTSLRSPRFVFDNDSTTEPEFGYTCSIDGAAYAPCEEGPTSLADGDHTLKIKLVDGAGNIGTVESAERTFTVGTAPAAAPEVDPTPYVALSHPTSASIYGEGLHVSTGAMEDPAGRIWVTDHNAGFCRMTDPTIDGAGRIEHPELPGAPRREPRTCLGGLLPDAGPGADAAGPPAFVDPTPKQQGSGDEFVLIADGFAGSNFLVRFRWDADSELFEYVDQLPVPAVDRAAADRARPVTTQVGPDPDGINGPKQPSVFFVSKRDNYVGRVDQAASDAPSVHVAGFVSAAGRRAEVLAVGQRTEGAEQHPVIYLVSQAGLEKLDDPRIEGEEDAPATVAASVTAIPGVTNAGALAYDLQRDLLYVGTAEGVDPTSVGSDRFLRVDPATMAPVGDAISGFSMIGGIGIRNDGRILVVDDRALLDPAEPMGEGRMYQIGNPAARIASGPSDPENNAKPGFTSSTTPSFALAGDTPRECWVRPAVTPGAPDWRSCDAASYTTPVLGQGAHKLTVRATAGSTAESVGDTTRYVPHTVGFEVDSVAPSRPSVTSIAPLSPDGVTNAAPFFTFAGEPGVRYGCRLNSSTYNKVPCQPGRTFPLSGAVRVQNGLNTLFIKATDNAGNASAESTPFSFVADTTIPTVTISSPEEGQVTGPETRFVFKASQVANTMYACRMDGATFKRCDRPTDAGGAGRPADIRKLPDGSIAVTYTALSTGDHRFQVHASDNHGNVSPNATRNITVDPSVAAPPALPADEGPPSIELPQIPGLPQLPPILLPILGTGGSSTTTAPRIVPLSISRPVLRTLGLPVAFRTDEGTQLSRVQIFRAVDGQGLAASARAASGAGTKEKVTFKRIASITRTTAKAGLYRLRLKDRAVRNGLKPGMYRVEVAQRRADGDYAKPIAATIQVKSGKKQQ
jgi:hypothetical protein